MTTLSASQVKNYKNNKAEWAGKYILGIKDNSPKKYFDLGKAFHLFMEHGDVKKGHEFINNTTRSLEEKEELWVGLEKLVENASEYEEDFDTEPKREELVKGKIWGVDFIGYIDCLCPDRAIDYKTATYKTTEDSKPRMGANLSPYEEYELQAYIYMKLANVDRCDFVEVFKKKVKKYDKQYNIVTFEMSEEFDEKMRSKYLQDVLDMVNMRERFNG